MHGNTGHIHPTKPWPDRALENRKELERAQDALMTFGLQNAPIAWALKRAIELLGEAAARGVKGSEPKP